MGKYRKATEGETVVEDIRLLIVHKKAEILFNYIDAMHWKQREHLCDLLIELYHNPDFREVYFGGDSAA